MANPLVSQGTLNRLRGSVVWNDHPELNVTAPFLGKDGIGLTLNGEATQFYETMTGAVTSPQPYQSITLTMNLLKTQPLSDAYKARQELLALLGDGVVRPDSAQLSPYQLVNCSIEGVAPLKFSGEDAGYVVTIKGYYNINSSLWDG